MDDGAKINAIKSMAKLMLYSPRKTSGLYDLETIYSYFIHISIG